MLMLSGGTAAALWASRLPLADMHACCPPDLTACLPPSLLQVDSASTPEQLSRLLDDVKDAGAKRVLLVFGCPGTSTAQERGAMAEVGGCEWTAMLWCSAVQCNAMQCSARVEGRMHCSCMLYPFGACRWPTSRLSLSSSQTTLPGLPGPTTSSTTWWQACPTSCSTGACLRRQRAHPLRQLSTCRALQPSTACCCCCATPQLDSQQTGGHQLACPPPLPA